MSDNQYTSYTSNQSFNKRDWVHGEIITEQEMDDLDFKASSGGNSILISNNEPTDFQKETNKIWINTKDAELVTHSVPTINDLTSIIAPLYNSAFSYPKGSYVIKSTVINGITNYNLYQILNDIPAHTENFNSYCGNPVSLGTDLRQLQLRIAYPFYESQIYRIGDYVTYGDNGQIYKITADHAAGTTWNNTYKVIINLADELQYINNKLITYDAPVVGRKDITIEMGEIKNGNIDNSFNCKQTGRYTDFITIVPDIIFNCQAAYTMSIWYYSTTSASGYIKKDEKVGNSYYVNSIHGANYIRISFKKADGTVFETNEYPTLTSIKGNFVINDIKDRTQAIENYIKPIVSTMPLSIEAGNISATSGETISGYTNNRKRTSQYYAVEPSIITCDSQYTMVIWIYRAYNKEDYVYESHTGFIGNKYVIENEDKLRVFKVTLKRLDEQNFGANETPIITQEKINSRINILESQANELILNNSVVYQIAKDQFIQGGFNRTGGQLDANTTAQNYLCSACPIAENVISATVKSGYRMTVIAFDRITGAFAGFLQSPGVITTDTTYKAYNTQEINFQLLRKNYPTLDFRLELFLKVYSNDDDTTITPAEESNVTFAISLNDVPPKDYFLEELATTVETVKSKLTEPALVFPLVTDIHYLSGGKTNFKNTFDNCIDNIKAFCKEVKCDFIANLGDNTDGNVTQDITLKRNNYMMKRFLEINLPYFFAVGNHDTNYQYTNGNFDEPQTFMSYLSSTHGVTFDTTDNENNYYKDFDELGIRVIFLDANYLQQYKYTANTANWLNQKALKTDYIVILCEHLSSINTMNWNGQNLTNGGSITTALTNFVHNGGTLIQLCGHSHADYYYTDPWLTIFNTCQKFSQSDLTTSQYQSITGYVGSMISPERIAGTATEDAWNIVIVKPRSKTIDVVRFGAGADRTFTFDGNTAEPNSLSSIIKCQEFLNDRMNGFTPNANWEAGQINTGGVASDSHKRIRSADFISLSRLLEVTGSQNAEIAIRFYDSNKTFISASGIYDNGWHSPGWFTKEKIFTLMQAVPTAVYCRFNGRYKNSDEDMTDSERIALMKMIQFKGLISGNALDEEISMRQLEEASLSTNITNVLTQLNRSLIKPDISKNAISWTNNSTGYCQLAVTRPINCYINDETISLPLMSSEDENPTPSAEGTGLYDRAMYYNDNNIVRLKEENGQYFLYGGSFAIVYDTTENKITLKNYSNVRNNSRYIILFGHSWTSVPATGLLVNAAHDDEIKTLSASIKDYLNNDIEQSITLQWEIGHILPTGANSANDKRIRTGYYSKYILSTITPDEGASIAVRLYSEKNENSLVYSDSNWRTATLDLKQLFTNKSTANYVRIIACYSDNAVITDLNSLSNMIHPTALNTATSLREHTDLNTKNFIQLDQEVEKFNKQEMGIPAGISNYFITEAEACRDSLELICDEPCYLIGFVTDSHYYGYGDGNNWPRTVKNIMAVNTLYPLDCIIHGGDIVTGNLAKSSTIRDIRTVRNSMTANFKNVIMLTGNHDDNSYYDPEEREYDTNTDWLNDNTLFGLFGRLPSTKAHFLNNYNACWWDIEELNLRIICLDAILPNSLGINQSTNWGYSAEEIAWLTSVLASARNNERHVAIFSHMPATPSLMNLGTNGVLQGSNIGDTPAENTVRKIINNFIADGGIFVGWFHGHTHRDKITKVTGNNFTECATGCSMCNGTVEESTNDYGKQEARALNTVTEDLWDIIVIKPYSKTVKLVRFGAGDDRDFNYLSTATSSEG